MNDEIAWSLFADNFYKEDYAKISYPIHYRHDIYSLIVNVYKKRSASLAHFYSLIFWYNIINFCPVKFSCLNLISAFLIHDICWSLTMREILIMTIKFRSILG